MPRRVSGVSLIELLVVLVLVALAGTLTLALHGGGLDGMRLRGSAKEVAAQLRYARVRAIATGHMQRFEIDPLRRRWQAPSNRTGRIPETVTVEFFGAREIQSRTGIGTIAFFEDGGSTGGQVRLRAGRLEWRVEVAWLTGEVRMIRDVREETK